MIADTTNTLSTIARQAIESCRDTDKACNYVRKQLEKSGALDEIRESLVDSAIRTAVLQSGAQIRSAFRANACSRGVDAIEAAGKIMALTILDTWVGPGGKMLGDTMAEELLPFSKSERERATGHAINATFFEKLAKHTKKGKRVRDCVTPEQADELLRAATEGK